MINVDAKKLQTLYIAYFGRPGDPSGINYWLSCSKELLTIKDISNELSRQDEYTKFCALDKSLEFKINKVYLNLFNRKADFDGLNYWIELLKNKDYQISDIVFDLVYLSNKSYSTNSDQEKKDVFILVR